VCCERSIRKDEIAWSRYNSYLKLLEGMMKIIVLTFIMKIEQLVTKTENSKDLICQNYLIY
jgi:hypothetical protein